MSDINIDLPGWNLVVDRSQRKVFYGEDHRFTLDVRGDTVDITVEERK